jgi:membrane dipeptidase
MFYLEKNIRNIMFDLNKEQLERASKLHSESIVVDTHNDTILNMMSGRPPTTGKRTTEGYREFSLSRTLREKSDEGQIDIPRIKEGGVNCLFFAMYVSPSYRGRLRKLLQMLDVFYSQIDINKDEIQLATTYQDVINIVQKGKIASVLTIEGGEPLEEDLGSLRMLYKLGARSMTLTHFPRNELGDGSATLSDSHLTEFGRAVVEEMNKLGMIVDVSHINERGYWDVLDVTNSPAIASHSNCKALCNYHRNISDDQIRALADNGGVLNLSYCPPFIKPGLDFDSSSEKLHQVVLNDWLDHLDHACKLVGPDHLGLGSDFDGGCGFPEMNNITFVPRITQGMVKRGYSDEDIEKILGKNNLRVMKKVFK